MKKVLRYKHYLLFSLLMLTFKFAFAQLHIEGTLYIEDTTTLFVENDLILNTTEGLLTNNGAIHLKGSFLKDADSNFESNSNNTGIRKVIFISKETNEPSIIDGSMVDENAFFNLELDLEEGGVLSLHNNIEVSTNLNLKSGRLRTDIISNTSGLGEFQYLH